MSDHPDNGIVPVSGPCEPGAGQHMDIERILIPRRRIAARVRALAGRIGADLGDQPVLLAAIMTGSLIFVADLIRHLPMKMQIHLVGLNSYGGAARESDGVVQLLGERGRQATGRQVLIVDDILDSGRTLATVVERCRSAQARSVRTCVLLRKPPARRAPEGLGQVDYVGFDVPDVFVVGYGLDCDGYYRNLPDIAVLKPKA